MKQKTIVIAGGWRLHASLRPVPHSHTHSLHLQTSYAHAKDPSARRTLLQASLHDDERQALIDLLQSPEQTS